MPSLDELNSPDYLSKLRQQAEANLAPSRDLALNEIGLAEQGLGQQENTIKTQNDLALQSLNQSQTDVNRQADTLAKQLADEAIKSRGYLTEQFNNLGLLQSGLTASGLGDIQKNLVKGQTETEQDRASRLAQLAIQRSGLSTSLQSDLSNLALQRAGLGNRRTQVQQGYTADVNDLVNQILNRELEIEKTRIAVEQAAADRAAAIKSSSGGSVGSILSSLLSGKGSAPQVDNRPRIGNMFVDDIKSNIKGTDIIATYINEQGKTVTGPVSREKLATILSGAAWGTSQWNAVREQIYQIVPNIKKTSNNSDVTKYISTKPIANYSSSPQPKATSSSSKKSIVSNNQLKNVFGLF